MFGVFKNHRWFAFGALNVLFCLLLLVGAAAGGGSIAVLPYVTLLFALCSSALPFIEKANDAFAVLGVTAAIYFVTFGMLDAVSMFSPPTAAGDRGGFLTPGEIVILIGVSMLIAGFHLATALLKPKGSPSSRKEWPMTTLLVLGLLLWSAGCGANLYRALILLADNSNAAAKAGFSELGIWLTSLLILIQVYAGPLGIVLLAYWWTNGKRRLGGLLILGVIVCQFAVGWMVDTKSVALSAPLIILLTRFFAAGRVPVKMLLAAILAASMTFPILAAKRVIMNEANLSKLEALSHTGEILARAVKNTDEYRTNKYGSPTTTFLERSTDKGAVEIFAREIGVTHPFKMGETLEPLLYTFVPRVIWSTKPGANSAQTFNREFHISADPDTYISPTHMGELYWNFGFSGVIIGMLISGALIGWVGVRFDQSKQKSLTGVLVVMVTVYVLVFGRGGSIGNEYVVWIRSLALIGVLHILFARRVVDQTAEDSGAEARGSSQGGGQASVMRFPHLLR